ncbi:AbrB/MazE/SpoVT family DNA-binding domain-containing protein [Acidianus sp. DSM 29099]|nr:AbrB/MazE/SpoVT family DNA-binding domain-containing protein [Acidianus sp. RZ1]
MGERVVFMEYILRVDEKGRIVIPKDVRERLNISNVVKLVVKDNEVFIRPLNKGDLIKKYEGMFKVDLEKAEVDEILKEALGERGKKWLKDILT